MAVRVGDAPDRVGRLEALRLPPASGDPVTRPRRNGSFSIDRRARGEDTPSRPTTGNRTAGKVPLQLEAIPGDNQCRPAPFG
ncbi:MAG TPA: hypothetical protein DCQ98_17220 [Planctomycetaceae bacterium]|nr:hypothetical protein [Planctomycetaceae bacterium]